MAKSLQQKSNDFKKAKQHFDIECSNGYPYSKNDRIRN